MDRAADDGHAPHTISGRFRQRDWHDAVVSTDLGERLVFGSMGFGSPMLVTAWATGLPWIEADWLSAHTSDTALVAASGMLAATLVLAIATGAWATRRSSTSACAHPWSTLLLLPGNRMRAFAGAGVEAIRCETRELEYLVLLELEQPCEELSACLYSDEPLRWCLSQPRPDLLCVTIRHMSDGGERLCHLATTAVLASDECRDTEQDSILTSRLDLLALPLLPV